MMRRFIFLWSARNEEHIAEHGVAPDEAQYVVEHARPPYPAQVGDEKPVVWGQTSRGRFLQVVFVYAAIEDIELEEYERLQPDERDAIVRGEEATRVVHARELTSAEKRRFRRRK